MEINEVLQLIERRTGLTSKKNDSGFMSCCPAHDDSNPSLSVSEADDGKVLLKCFSGCSYEDICRSIGIKVSDLFPKNHCSTTPKKTIYSYRDENGKELYRKIRIEPGFDGKEKSFYSERDTETGNTIKSIKGCRKVLYRLPELLRWILEKKTVFLVEGEKDADNLINRGLAASTAIDSLSWLFQYTEVLKNADVVILYDMDETGNKRRELLCGSLEGKVRRLRIVDLPGLVYRDSHGADVSDWLLQGNTTENLLELVNKASDYKRVSNEYMEVRVVTMDEFLDMELPKREMLLSPILPEQGLGMLFAKRGAGKTHVALGIAYAVASGGKFFKWHASKPKKVLYIDGEMPASSMQERLRRIAVAEEGKLPSPEYLRLITPDMQEGYMPDLSTKEGQILVQTAVQESDLIIVDNISCLFRTGVENEAESWRPAQEWALNLRRNGKSILFIHHAGKNGAQRGSSKKEDILDVVINLQQPPGYGQEQGACFNVIFEKARHFSGDEAAPFFVQLKEEEDGLFYWEISANLIDAEVELIAEKINQGLTIKQIMEETNLSKSQVETRKKKAFELGLVA